jgi:hypothetical protein
MCVKPGEKVEDIYAWFGSRKWFWLCIIAQVAVAGERLSSAVHLQKRV